MKWMLCLVLAFFGFLGAAWAQGEPTLEELVQEGMSQYAAGAPRFSRPVGWWNFRSVLDLFAAGCARSSPRNEFAANGEFLRFKNGFTMYGFSRGPEGEPGQIFLSGDMLYVEFQPVGVGSSPGGYVFLALSAVDGSFVHGSLMGGVLNPYVGATAPRDGERYRTATRVCRLPTAALQR